jgi:septation ring formation regulator EzrA
MSANQPQIEEINELIRAVEQRIGSLMHDLETLDESENADAYHAIEVQIRSLKDQQRILNKRWSELTEGFLDDK